ncbi:MAG: Oar protein [Candidatus Angelobacter sp.]|nr:Oar protein [Candidatus Angelobacter sp.]
MNLNKPAAFLIAFMLLLTFALPVGAQTISTGDIAGTVTDSSGAVVPNATVTVKDVGTGAGRTVATNSSGAYRVPLLKPGTYNVSAAATGLTTQTFKAAVAVGQVQVVNLIATPQAATEVVEVTSSAPLLNTENANLSTSFNSTQLSLLPMPGGDITTVAFTAPGVAVSTGAGFGGFSSFGLPATSNLFTVNGNDNMDPYLNLNNSGASNLTLGSSEIQEAVVVQNGYGAQYGRQAGAQVNFTTKSGGNQFHGTAQYNWNGAVLNANDWFNNNTGTPKGKANSNQWMGSISGPIKKDELFFFYSNEGLRYILPSSGTVSLPSPLLQQYILSNVSAAQVPFYTSAFKLYNNAPGISRAVPVTGPVNSTGTLQDGTGTLGCGSFSAAAPGGGTFGVDQSCAIAFNTNESNLNKEWLQVGRVDWNINDKQKAFFRFKMDHGVQPTFTDPLNPALNVISTQPSYEGQFNHSYIISPIAVNNFTVSGNYYSAIFSPADLPAAIALLPDYMRFFEGGANGSGSFTSVGLNYGSFPQGRNVGQYAVLDDVSINKGSHALKFGVNFRRNNVTDSTPLILQDGGRYSFFDVTEFANGSINPASGSSFQQRFSSIQSAHIALYSLGLYLQDEWAVKRNLKFSFALRGDINENPKCNTNCFARFNNTFSDLAKGIAIPYNQSITTGLDSAFPQIEKVAWQPRFGFNYSPFGSQTTVIRGGVGVFADLFPGTLASSVFGNSPNIFTPSLRLGTVNSGGAGSSPVLAAQTNAAFQSGFTGGQTRAQIGSALAALGTTFTEPGYFATPDKVLNPKYLEWNFEIQQAIGKKNVLTINYVGNHGYDEFLRNADANAWLNTGGSVGTSFVNAGLPTGTSAAPGAPDPRFRIVTQLTNSGVSNYNGLTTTFRRSMGYGFQGEVSYTWSHSLDDISNGGLGEFFSGDSFTTQSEPGNPNRLGYSNSDYDIRHNLTGDFVWLLPYKFQNRAMESVLGGWSLASKVFWRSGTPFSVFNSSLAGAISNSIGGTVLADVRNPNVIRSCQNPADPCFTAADFAPTKNIVDPVTKQITTPGQADFGNNKRNTFRGPHYADADMTINKQVFKVERFGMTVGANMYNVFNHPNFASPLQNVSGSGFGSIQSTVTAPSSPYGSFQGSAVSGRVIQLTARLSF